MWYSLPVKVFVGFWWSEQIFEYLWVSFFGANCVANSLKVDAQIKKQQVQFERNMVLEGLGGSRGGLGTILAPRGQQGSPELVRLTPPSPGSLF